MKNDLALKNVRTIDFVSQIANSLEEAILDGSLGMGTQLIETEIARSFHSSRQPIREAFRVLENRGLVTIVPRKGAFVKKITQKDFEDYFPVRAMLDGLAGRLAYRSISTEDIENLNLVLERMAKSASKKEFRTYLNFHYDFHAIINMAADNQILINFLTMMRTTHAWFLLSSLEYFRRHFDQSLEYHKKIVKEFERKRCSENEIEQLFREHVLISLDFYRECWAEGKIESI
ncbi:MAG: GntR family transcriptional regulator [Proteobacteria bacterium]|nr:GntR family transcriptional regulator [Pseudomonadota bacterium]